MVTDSLLTYIKQQLAKGTAREIIEKNLLAAGWRNEDVIAAFNQTGVTPATSFVQTSAQASPVVNSPIIQASSIQSTEPSKSLGRIIPKLIILLLLVLLGAGGAYAYFNYLAVPALTPDQVMQKMMANLPNIKTLEYAGELKVKIDPSKFPKASTTEISSVRSMIKEDTSFNLNLSGVTEVHGSIDSKSSLIITASANSVASGTITALGLEMRRIGQTIYVKLTEAPNLGFFSLEPLKNQWVKIDFAEIKQRAQSTFSQFGTSTAMLASSTPDKLTLTTDQLIKIKQAVDQSQVIKVTAQLPNEQLAGVETYHYQLAVDKAELKKLLLAVAAIVQDRTPSTEELEKLDSALASAELPKAEIWIGQTDFYPYKLLLTPKVKTAAEVGEISITLSFKNFNQPITVAIPTPVKTVEEFMAGLMGTSTNKSIKLK